MLWWDHVAERQADNLLDQHLYVSGHNVGAAELVHGRQNVECNVYGVFALRVRNERRKAKICARVRDAFYIAMFADDGRQCKYFSCYNA